MTVAPGDDGDQVPERNHPGLGVRGLLIVAGVLVLVAAGVVVVWRVALSGCRTDVEVTDAYGDTYRLDDAAAEGDAALWIDVTDYPVEDDEVLGDPPDDGYVLRIVVYLDLEAVLDPGATIVAGPSCEGCYMALGDAPAANLDNALLEEATGTLEVVERNDDEACLELEHESVGGSITGTISMPLAAVDA